MKIDIDSLKSRDHSVEPIANKLCKELGDEICGLLVTNCKEAPLVNSCVLVTFYREAMDAQICGLEKAIRCGEERVAYGKKLESFALKYASKPGYGRASLNICEPFHQVEPESDKLIEIQRSLDYVMEGLGTYMLNKQYYECVEEQYKKMYLK